MGFCSLVQSKGKNELWTSLGIMSVLFSNYAVVWFYWIGDWSTHIMASRRIFRETSESYDFPNAILTTDIIFSGKIRYRNVTDMYD